LNGVPKFVQVARAMPMLQVNATNHHEAYRRYIYSDAFYYINLRYRRWYGRYVPTVPTVPWVPRVPTVR